MRTKLFYALSALMISVMFVTSCESYDDTELRDRVDTLEEWQKKIDSEIATLQQLVEALEEKNFISSCTPLDDNSGYKITFKDGETITIKSGGEAATASAIGVKQVGDIYYWTMNGEFITDSAGEKIPTTGNDGTTPHIGSNNNWWIGTSDTGKQAVGSDGTAGANGTSVFADAKVEDGLLKVKLAGSTEWIAVPIVGNKVVFNAPNVGNIYYISDRNNIEFTVSGDFTAISALLTDGDVLTKVDANDKLELTKKSDNENGSTTYKITLYSGVEKGIIKVTVVLSTGEEISKSIYFEIVTTSDSTTGEDISDDINAAIEDNITSDGGSLSYLPKDETAAKESLDIEIPKTSATSADKKVEIDLTSQKGSVDLTIPAETKGDVMVKAAETEEEVTVKLPDAGSSDDTKNITVDAPKAKSITVKATESTEKIVLNVPSQSASEVVINAPASAEVKFSAPNATEPVTIKTTSNEVADALIIDAPNATVTLVKPDGTTITYKGVNVKTAKNTFIIGEGVTVDGLTISKGNVEVYGTLTGVITRSESNLDSETIIYIHKGATFTPTNELDPTIKVEKEIKEPSLVTGVTPPAITGGEL